MDTRFGSRLIAGALATMGVVAMLGLTGCSKDESSTGTTPATGGPAVQSPGLPTSGGEGTTGAPRAPGR